MLADGGAHRQDAVGGRAREADRPVPVRQGRVRRRANEATCGQVSARARRACALAALLARLRDDRRPIVEGDPFEPMNRAMYEVQRGRRRQRSSSPIAQAYVDVVPQADPHGRPQLLQQHRRPLLGDQRPAAGQARQGRQRHGPRDRSTRGSASAASSTSRRDAGIPKGNEDFGQTFGVLGRSAGAVPVRAAVRADDGARRHRAGSSASMSSPSATSPTCRCATSCTASAPSTCARRRCRRESLVDQAALDRYTFIRNAYLQRRRYLVYDGKPPPERRTTNE